MMFLFMMCCFLIFKSRNLLLSLIILEMIGFFMLYFLSVHFSVIFFTDYYLLILFSVLVMEGVMGLCGLIMLVSFSGSDYFLSSSFLKI